MGASDLDLTNLPRFFDHLADPTRDPDAAAFARLLVEQGAEVETFWGPVQMDVWCLTVRRGNRRVRFGIERGFADLVTVGTDGESEPAFTSLWLAVLGWARATRVPLVFDDPDAPRGHLLAHGISALDWLDAGNDEVLMRIREAQRRYRDGVFREAYRDPEKMREKKAQGLLLIEAAAAPHWR